MATTILLTARLRAGDPDAIRAVVAAIDATGGNAVHAARALGVSHRTMMRWVADMPVVASALRAARRARVETAT